MAKPRVMRRKESGEMEELDLTPQIMTEELASFIGTSSGPVVWEVERGAIRKYAQAVEDLNPLYLNSEYARNSKYGSIICPPGFFGLRIRAQTVPEDDMFRQIVAQTGRVAGVDMGGEMEFKLPVRAGDTIVSTTKIADIYEEVGRSGNRLLVSMSTTTYVNQNGDIVATYQRRGIYI